LPLLDTVFPAISARRLVHQAKGILIANREHDEELIRRFPRPPNWRMQPHRNPMGLDPYQRSDASR
jgi:hypothetical protein